MEKKDILIFGLVAIALAFSIYNRLKKRKKDGVSQSASVIRKKGLSDQPDDYEPYSGNRQ